MNAVLGTVIKYAANFQQFPHIVLHSEAQFVEMFVNCNSCIRILTQPEWSKLLSEERTTPKKCEKHTMSTTNTVSVLHLETENSLKPVGMLTTSGG